MGIIDDLIFGNALAKLTNVFVEIEMTRSTSLVGAGGGLDSLPASRQAAISAKLPKWLGTLQRRTRAEVTREVLKNMHVVQRSGNALRMKAQARMLETLVREGIAQDPDQFLDGIGAGSRRTTTAVDSTRRDEPTGQGSGEFEMTPMTPDCFKRKPVSGYLVGKVMVLFFEAPEPLAKADLPVGLPMKYLFAATVYDSAAEKMTRIFTLETGMTPDVFFCAFERTGAHTNIGPGGGMMRLSGFENSVLSIVCKETGSASFKTLNVQS